MKFFFSQKLLFYILLIFNDLTILFARMRTIFAKGVFLKQSKKKSQKVLQF